MRLLLDTHTLVWFLANDVQLSATATGLICDTGNDVFVSAATGWEIATKTRTGRWPEVAPLAQNFRNVLRREGFLELAITMEHACLSGSLPGAHRDPFDRMIAAQSLTENLSVISLDNQLDQFGISRLW